MRLTTLKTQRVYPKQRTIAEFVGSHVQKIENGAVIAVSSKIVALCQGDIDTGTKDELAKQHAQFYLDPEDNRYGQTLSVAQNTLLVAAGIDESNVENGVVLLPSRPNAAAHEIRDFLVASHGLSAIGVIIVDSASRPLRIGTVGTCIASAGLLQTKDYRGTRDIYGRQIEHTRANHTEALAAISVAAMGEGDEMTPICVMEDVGFVIFVDDDLVSEDPQVKLEDDLFAQLLVASKWHRGGAYDGQRE